MRQRDVNVAARPIRSLAEVSARHHYYALSGAFLLLLRLSGACFLLQDYDEINAKSALHFKWLIVTDVNVNATCRPRPSRSNRRASEMTARVWLSGILFAIEISLGEQDCVAFIAVSAKLLVHVSRDSDLVGVSGARSTAKTQVK